jgi:hypothetical protein
MAQATGVLSPRLLKLKNALTNVTATSTDSERAFSAASTFATKIRNRLSDKMLDNLSFGKAYYASQSNKAENIFYFIQFLCLCIFVFIFPFSLIKKTPGENFLN